MKHKTRIDIGETCLVTGNPIQKLTVEVRCFSYAENVEIYYFDDGQRQVDLQNSDIKFEKYLGCTVDVYGDFLPPKTTKSGKTVNKFLVLRIEKTEKGECENDEQNNTTASNY